MPPGGHIQKGETPLDTVLREFKEELRYELNGEKVELFELSVIKVSNPRRRCKIHYDFWYLVYLDQVNFKYDRKEVYNARWFTIEDALKTITREEYKSIVRKIANLVL